MNPFHWTLRLPVCRIAQCPDNPGQTSISFRIPSWTLREDLSRAKLDPASRFERHAVTFATAGDRHIYLLRSDLGFTTNKLKTTLLHESFHLRYPLPRGHSSRDKFVAELRAYYYAEFRDVKDLKRRFELAARSAAKDSGDVAIDGPDFAARVVNRAFWLQQIAL